MAKIPYFPTPDGHELPFVSERLHSVNGQRVPQRMLYPSQAMIEEKLRALPAGEAVDLASIRAELAREHGAEATCPVTTRQLFRAIGEEAAAEDHR
jgi:hypothetical protein